MWILDDLADAIASGLEDAERARLEEQAVHGTESLDETELHPLIAEALDDRTRHQLLREAPYPHEWVIKALEGLPEHRDRMRCDLALLPSKGDELSDLLHLEQDAERIRADGSNTLFQSHAEADADAHAPPDDAIRPEDAFWLEIKTVGQFAYRAGVPGPNPAYASELVKGITDDCRKLADDEMIRESAAGLVLFTHNSEIAAHDVITVVHKCLDKGLPVGAPVERRFEIPDRIGNHVCTVALIPVRG